LMNGATFAAGEGGQGFSFDGIDDYVSGPNSAAFQFTTPITVEAGIKTIEGYNRDIMTKNEDSFYLAVGPDGSPLNKFSFWLNNVTTAWLQSTTDVNDNLWHHVAGTYDGSVVRVYVDGRLENSVARSGSIQSGSSDVLIGRRPFGRNFS